MLAPLEVLLAAVAGCLVAEVAYRFGWLVTLGGVGALCFGWLVLAALRGWDLPWR